MTPSQQQVLRAFASEMLDYFEFYKWRAGEQCPYCLDHIGAGHECIIMAAAKVLEDLES